MTAQPTVMSRRPIHALSGVPAMPSLAWPSAAAVCLKGLPLNIGTKHPQDLDRKLVELKSDHAEAHLPQNLFSTDHPLLLDCYVSFPAGVGVGMQSAVHQQCGDPSKLLLISEQSCRSMDSRSTAEASRALGSMESPRVCEGEGNLTGGRGSGSRC